MSQEVEEVELNITPNELLVRKYFAGYNQNNYPVGSITFLFPLPVINAKAEDRYGRLPINITRRQVNLTEIRMDLRMPVSPGKKIAYKLTLLIDDSFVETIGSMKVLNWPKENITKIWLDRQELFFSSVLASINKMKTGYEIIPTSGSRNLISHSRNSSVVRIEYGKEISYRLEYLFSLKNNTPNSCFEVEAQTVLPPTTKYQRVLLLESPEGSSLETDQDNNSILKMHFNEIKGYETKTVRILLEIKPEKQFIDFETKMGDFQAYPSLTREDSLGAELIKPSKFWPIDYHKIVELARAAIKGLHETADVVKILFEFVNQKITYQKNLTRAPADQTMDSRVGDCSEFSDLLVTLLRRVRIPARVIHGWTYDPETNDLNGHAWTEYFTPNLGWIQCDPTWGFLAGVSCQHICRKREGVEVDLNDSSIRYNLGKGGNLEIDDKWRVLKIT